MVQPENLDGSHILSLPALRPFGHVKLHGLAFLQASESARLNGREMHENVLATLAADKAIALGVVEPLNCSLFHILVLLFLFESYVGGNRKKLAQVTCCVKARAAHDRIGLTHISIIRETCKFSKRKFHFPVIALFLARESSLGVSAHRE